MSDAALLIFSVTELVGSQENRISNPNFWQYLMKNILLLSLALLAVIALLYAGLNGLTKNHSYGFFFTFIGGITTVGLGLDVVNQLKLHVRKASVRKLGRF